MKPEGNCYVVHDEEKKLIRIGNERIERVFAYDSENGRFFTKQFINKVTGQNWAVSESREFCISIKQGGETVDVTNCYEGSQGGLGFKGCIVEKLVGGGKRLKATREHPKPSTSSPLSRDSSRV